ncbi:DUF411 domain-containing protein [Ramlibacter sp. AN1015]|uniref:DUF411 domain-containing protein n=1 Tax=Ramlibacter sp. AN1015 TaxID=3133428 RepID=UPI0030BC37BA
MLAGAGGGVEVWKDPSCGCCTAWVKHLEANGFQTTIHEVGNNTARARLGVAQKFGSCHATLVGGYAVEGHVPAREIARLLKERPQRLGLAVPGMPVGSPGMDSALYKGRKDPYSVMLLSTDGNATVYHSYGGNRS